MPNQMRPIHPGEILKGEMEELGLSARQLAMALGVPTNRVTSIVHEARALTADTALRLARYFGTSPEFWLNLQSAYELRRAQQERGARIAQEVVPRAAMADRKFKRPFGTAPAGAPPAAHSTTSRGAVRSGHAA